MSTVTIPQKEYEKLLDAKLRYDYLKRILEGNLFSPPPTRSRKVVLSALKATRRYDQAFLRSMQKGLRRSDYFK